MFSVDEYGFWKQDNPKPFEYTDEYAGGQSTNELMVGLRFGWIAAIVGYDQTHNAHVVDVGAGSKATERFGSTSVGKVESYDVTSDTITTERLMSTNWDIAIFADVIEHVDDLGYMFSIPWKYAYLSFPETPPVGSWENLKDWRHFKPDEHIWMLNSEGFVAYTRDHHKDCKVLCRSNFEDNIRKRWDPERPNISSLFLART